MERLPEGLEMRVEVAMRDVRRDKDIEGLDGDKEMGCEEQKRKHADAGAQEVGHWKRVGMERKERRGLEQAGDEKIEVQ